jgi:hypothetical protein
MRNDTQIVNRARHVWRDVVWKYTYVCRYDDDDNKRNWALRYYALGTPLIHSNQSVSQVNLSLSPIIPTQFSKEKVDFEAFLHTLDITHVCRSYHKMLFMCTNTILFFLWSMAIRLEPKKYVCVCVYSAKCAVMYRLFSLISFIPLFLPIRFHFFALILDSPYRADDDVPTLPSSSSHLLVRHSYEIVQRTFNCCWLGKLRLKTQ